MRCTDALIGMISCKRLKGFESSMRIVPSVPNSTKKEMH